MTGPVEAAVPQRPPASGDVGVTNDGLQPSPGSWGSQSLLALLPKPLAPRAPSIAAVSALDTALLEGPEAPVDLPRRCEAVLPLEQLRRNKSWSGAKQAAALELVLGILQVSRFSVAFPPPLSVTSLNIAQ